LAPAHLTLVCPLNVCLLSGDLLGISKCVRVQPSTCCFLDADGLAPPKLLQLVWLLSTCTSDISNNSQWVLSSACPATVTVTIAFAFMRVAGGPHSAMHVSAVTLFHIPCSSWVNMMSLRKKVKPLMTHHLRAGGTYE
jgi:hypothetical protein